MWERDFTQSQFSPDSIFTRKKGSCIIRFLYVSAQYIEGRERNSNTFESLLVTSKLWLRNALMKTKMEVEKIWWSLLS